MSGQVASSTYVIVGFLERRNFRRTLQRLGVKHTEEKGWLDSQFNLLCTADEYWRVMSEYGARPFGTPSS